MFIDNKYKLWHDSIIKKALNRNIKGYFERHHILPKSLGGSNKKDNIVKLTAKEHFIVHMLLCKFTIGNAYHKMLYAFNAMSNIRYGKRHYKLHSRTAGILRKEFYKSIKGRKVSAETRLKQSLAFRGEKNPNYGKKFSKEHKRKLSEAKLGEKHILFGKKHKPETIQKMINKKLGKKYSLASRMKMSLSQKKYKLKVKTEKYLNICIALDNILKTNKELRSNI